MIDVILISKAIFGLIFINLIFSLFTKDYGRLYCGLIGFSGPFGLNEDKFKLLMFYNESRGGDSCGFYVHDKDTVHVIEDRIGREVGKVSEVMLPNYEIGSFTTAMAHTRKATTGGVSKATAHPFLFKIEGKKPLVGMHNGCVDNIFDLRFKYEETIANTPVDSMIIFSQLAKSDDMKILSEIAKLEHAVVWTRDDGILFVYRRLERPLFRGEVIHDNDTADGEFQGMYISSLKESLEAIGCEKIKEFKENTLYTIEKGVVIKTTPIKSDPYSRPVVRHEQSAAYRRNISDKNRDIADEYITPTQDGVEVEFYKSRLFGDVTDGDGVIKIILQDSNLQNLKALTSETVEEIDVDVLVESSESPFYDELEALSKEEVEEITEYLFALQTRLNSVVSSLRGYVKTVGSDTALEAEIKRLDAIKTNVSERLVYYTSGDASLKKELPADV